MLRYAQHDGWVKPTKIYVLLLRKRDKKPSLHKTAGEFFKTVLKMRLIFKAPETPERVHSNFMLPRRTGFFKFFFSVTLCFVLFLAGFDSSLFAQDVNSLASQGDEALRRGDLEQVLQIGARIIGQAPRDLRGYRLLLIYCAMNRYEANFYRTIQRARSQGVPELELDFLVATILYLNRYTTDAYERLCRYETKWRAVYDQSL